MKLEVIKPCYAHQAGDTIELPEMAAKQWIAQGFARAAESEEPDVKAMDGPPRDKAMHREEVRRKAKRRIE